MTNKDKLINIQKTEDMSKYLADEIYSIFRFNITKKSFKEELDKWLNSEVESYE